MEDTIKAKISVDYGRQRSIEYLKLCQQATRPLDDACKKCARIKYWVKDGILSPICHETCDMYKATQERLNEIKKRFDNKF